MSFRLEEVEAFKDIFTSSCELIRASEGCEYLELIQDVNDQRIFFTISIWRDAESLNNYRNSELFGRTWKATKALFDQKPEVWSADVIKQLS